MKLSKFERVAKIERIFKTLGTMDPSRVLSAMGHPGYGSGYANQVLKEYVKSGRDLHSIVYGGSVNF
jgi:hypothetical protein